MEISRQNGVTPGPWLSFEITHWQEGRHGSWTVAGVPATGHLVGEIDPDSCEVTCTIPAWAPFYVPVCRAALRAIERLATQAEPRR